MQLSRLLAKMEGSGRKGKEEKRKLPDGDFNEATITLDAKRTTKDGKADVSAGFVATYYEHPDGTVVEANRVVELSLKRFVDCEHLIDVARVVKDLFRALEHVKDSEMRFQKGEHVMLDVEDFLEHLRGSESTSPVQVFCRAPGGLVADTTPLQRNLYERYREVWTMTATPSNVRRVQCPQDCSEFSELGHFTRPAEERYRLFVPQNLEERYRQFAPSSMTTKKVRRVQLAGSELGPLYKCGRPLDALGLEAPLMHPVFGTFMKNVRNASLPTREDYAFVQEFCLKSSEFYNNERDRQTALKNLLKPYLWRTVDPREINGYEVDGYIGRCTGFPVYSILEFENELGSTSVDKYFHGQRCYAEFCDIARSNTCDSAIFTSCNCPAFLVEFRGAQMRISAMGYFDRVHTSMLTDLVNLSWGNENLPRIFKALKVGIDNLQLFYEEVEDVGRTSTRVNWLEKVVPYPVWWNPRYTFKKSLRTSDLRKHLFLAEDDQKQNVLIKFSNRYGEEVHKAWYNAGFAPKLLDVEELAGGFKMIAMEYLGPPWQMLVLLDTETKERARLAVREALQKVHRLRVFDSPHAGSVHGDVRDVNIMVRSHGEEFDVRFVDFDWAGQEFVSTYPPNMNHATIAWPEGIVDGKPMLQTHDMDVLNSGPAILTSNYNWRRNI